MSERRRVGGPPAAGGGADAGLEEPEEEAESWTRLAMCAGEGVAAGAGAAAGADAGERGAGLEAQREAKFTT